MKVTSAEYRVMLRNDLYTFIERCFYQLNPDTPFFPNWHLHLIAAKLEACFDGRIRRLIINVPPRSLKSIAASVAFIAWMLGRQPGKRVLSVTYGQSLSDKLALDCRAIMQSRWYQDTFPTRLSTAKSAVHDFETTAQGGRMASSVGGVLTGRGFDVIVIDDALKPDEAVSESLRNSTNLWYQNSLYSRLNDKNTGCIILIMQRLHEDDLTGHVLGLEHWDQLRLQAIADEEERYLIETALGSWEHVRQAGDVLHPERESRELLAKIKKNMGSYDFAGQYQQMPAPLEGGMIKRDWFKSYEEGDLPKHFDMVLQSWDTANKATELSDYSVCTTWGTRGDRIYLLHVLRDRLNYPELKRAAKEQARLWKPGTILIEDKASGTSLIQDLLSEGEHAVTSYKPEMEKVMRMHAQTAVIENGFVYVPKQASWLADYLHEMTTFKNSKYDDQVDSTSQALDWIKTGTEEPGALVYMRMEGNKRRQELGLPPLGRGGVLIKP